MRGSSSVNEGNSESEENEMQSDGSEESGSARGSRTAVLKKVGEIEKKKMSKFLGSRPVSKVGSSHIALTPKHVGYEYCNASVPSNAEGGAVCGCLVRSFASCRCAPF